MLRLKKVTLAVGAAIGSGLLGLTPHVAAQTGTQALDRVEITGTLLKRIEGETALPVVTISVDEIVKAGATNAEQAVRLITQNASGTVSSSSVSGTNGAASYASLRGLGEGRTLVLLNGRRIVNNPYSSIAVDLNTLPMAAIDRIETLTDGASATYGTDAIAGVINFITRKEYSGVAIGAEAQIPEAGGGEIYIGNLLMGFGSLAKQGWNVYGGLNYRMQEPMGGLDRDFSRTAYIPERGFNALSPVTFPGNYSQTGTISNTNPSIPNNCFPPTSLYVPTTMVAPLGNNLCGADTQAYTKTVPEQEQWSAFLKGSMALGANHTLSGEYFFARNRLQSAIAPSPESSGLNMPNTSPFYPGNGITPITDPALDPTRTIAVNWRTTVLGSRVTEQVNDTQRAVGTIEGTLAGWDYQAAALWSKSETTQDFVSGWPKIAALRNGIAGTNGAPYLNPFGDQSAAGLAYMQDPNNQVLGIGQVGEGILQSLSAVASRQFGALPGGPMAVALATEYREEEMTFKTDVPKVSASATSGLAGQGALREGDRQITAFALEANFPILKNLELGASIRYDDYSDFGSTTNPKVTLRFTPTPTVLLRASYNTGFAAPSLTQLYAPNATTFTATRYNDPVLCPNGVVNTAAGGIPSRDCGIQFQRLTGGNPNLTPEESEAWSAGIVLQPLPTVSFSIDYWRYTVQDTISSGLSETAIFGDTAKYGNLFVRCSQADPARAALVPGCNQPGGDPLAYIINTNLNLGDYKTSGYDFAANWTPAPTRYGQFSVAYRATYVDKFRFQLEPNGTWFDPVGNYSAQWGGPVIRFRQVVNVGWQMNDFGANLIYRFASGYKDQNASTIAAAYRDNTVGDYAIFDLAFSYTGIKNLTLRAGILNVLDTDPPFTNQQSRFQARGYDDRFHNPLGRTFTLAARYEF